ncbi:hypothetical protein [Paenibacillus sp. S150]|uniref:hypothetical protein n=1 Tax=Paenibacillus sp. S150 TaxID=2749826 RepID=UPI001C595D42|nr:hypothetical protein [Paenibacillus sp. S150]MBW4084407.1 hypothetical protein [Paenibacillus sp. S150]
MGNEFNKTEADFAYERYTKMGGISPEQDIPLEELRPLGTITGQSRSGKSSGTPERALESALASHDPAHAKPVDWDGVVDDGADPALVGDSILAADIDLNAPEPALGRRADRAAGLTAPPPAERDEVLESDAMFAAEAAGLAGSAIDYAGDEALVEDEEELPLEDIPDADELEPGTAIDPAAPPIDAMPGTDVLNGSRGDEE